jgi:hypothetical protein
MSVTVILDPSNNLNQVVTNPSVCGNLRFGGTPQAYLSYNVPASTGTVYINTCADGDASLVRMPNHVFAAGIVTASFNLQDTILAVGFGGLGTGANCNGGSFVCVAGNDDFGTVPAVGGAPCTSANYLRSAVAVSVPFTPGSSVRCRTLIFGSG